MNIFCLIIREPQWRGGIFAVDLKIHRELMTRTKWDYELRIVNYELHKIEGGRFSRGNTAFLG